MTENGAPWAGKLGVFDLETTGVDVSTCRIVSANVSVLNAAGDVVERNDWVVDPGIPVPEQAARIHGYTTERLQREGQTAVSAVQEIVAALERLFGEDTAVVAYNAPYDFSVLHHEAVRYQLGGLTAARPIIDPLVIDKSVDRYRRGKRTLDVVAAHYGVELLDAHDAASDAIAAGRVAQAQARKFSDALNMTASELHDRQVEWASSQARNFQEYMRTRRGRPEFVADGSWPLRR